MKLGRRLMLVLLLTMTPVVAVYTYWSVEWSNRNYIADLKSETRATTRALAPVVASYIARSQWVEVHQILQRMGADGTEGAVLQSNGQLWYEIGELPHGLVATAMYGLPHAVTELPRFLTVVTVHAASEKSGFDFEASIGDSYWFCRIVPLNVNNRVLGYLVVAQDWTNIDEDLRQRMLPPIGAALIVVALIGVLIPILVSHYVSGPLAHLSRKVVSLSEGEPTSGAEDELKLISEEFQRLDRQLIKARSDLLDRYRYERELDRRLQRADRLATIGTLASGLAHEIGTPMGVIRTRAELLLRATQTEKAREGLQIIIGQIERISTIVRMLLDYSRGRESRRSRCDARTIVGQILKLIESEANRKRVRIITDLGDRSLMVDCDPDQLQQVFVNLAINAFDAMTPDGGALRVNAAIDKREHRAELKVTFDDTGSGVPPELRKHLFDPFFTTKPPGKGTGMGLPVSQAIMRDHGGDVIYEATPSGARFSIIMPLADTGARA